ncbi:glycosyltransferase [Kitasatospora azatica]|uniref:glycosyltransferase n=1 Tax=Kitasatospora azatica TaxID=58347 RepID=UPI00056B795E|nr:glycosyltransferase [Kitasatospora azatica]
MRILFTTWSAPAHLHPMVPLARACQDAGHEVLLAVPPGCAAAVTAAGLTPVPVGAEPAAPPIGAVRGLPEDSWPADWPLRPAALGPGPRRVLDALVGRQAAIAEAMLPDLLGFARHWRPALVVSDASTYAGTLVADLLGVPLAHHQWGGPAVLELERGGPGGQPRPAYQALCERFGANPRRAPQVWIDPCPPSLRLPSPVRRLALRTAAAPRTTADRPTRTDQQPRVLIGLEDGAPVDLLRLAADQLAVPYREVTLPLGPDRPLPGGALLIHHGSGILTMAAAAHGIPQLVVSLRPEQALTGDRLAAIGAARHLPRAAAGAAELRTAGLALLADPARAAARRLAAEIAALPDPAALVPRLAELAD